MTVTFACVACDATCDPQKDHGCFLYMGTHEITVCESCRVAWSEQQAERDQGADGGVVAHHGIVVARRWEVGATVAAPFAYAIFLMWEFHFR